MKQEPKATSWKDIVQYTTAVAALASGITLSFFLYFAQGDLLTGVLGYVAQVLMYAAGIFGATMYWNGKYNELKHIVQNGSANLVSSSQKNAH